MLRRDGQPVRISGTVQDVTAAKERAQGLEFLSALAGAANEARNLDEVLIAFESYVRAPGPVARRGGRPAGPLPGDALDFLDIHYDGRGRDGGQRPGAGHRAVRERDIVHAAGPDGEVQVAGPVFVGDRLVCVIAADTLARSAPSPADLAIFQQMLVMLAHVAERSWAADEIAEARDEALQASRAKSDFLATMSHEIRTPLNGVIGLSELLRRTTLDSHQRRLATGIDDAGRTLLALVNDILDLSKIEAGRLDLEEVDFDPRLVLEQSVGLVAGRARSQGLELLVSSAADMPALVRGDPVRFGQVITNLASNAVKFTAEGEVSVRATGVPTPPGGRCGSRCATPGSGSLPRRRRGSSRPSPRPTAPPPASTAAPGWAWRSPGGSSPPWAATSASGASPAPAAPSGSWSTSPSRSRSGRTRTSCASAAARVAGPGRRRQRDQPVHPHRAADGLGGGGDRGRLRRRGRAGARREPTAGRRGPTAPFDVVLLDYMMPGTNGAELARSIRPTAPPAPPDRARDLGRRAAADWLADAGIDAFLAKPVLPAALLAVLAGTVPARGRAHASPDHPGARASDQPGPAGGRGRVLVVEDNHINQVVAEGVLRRLGYDVVIAENGAVAVAAVADDPEGFAAVLMDCQMPVMDGFDATRAIRAVQSEGRRTPVIAMTAAAAADERLRCLDAGMDDFLAKPIDVPLLASTLARWVTGSEPAEQPSRPRRRRVRASGGRTAPTEAGCASSSRRTASTRAWWPAGSPASVTGRRPWSRR